MESHGWRVNRSETDGCVTVTVTGMNRFDGEVEIGGMEERREIGREGNGWEGEEMCVRGRVVGWMIGRWGE